MQAVRSDNSLVSLEIVQLATPHIDRVHAASHRLAPPAAMCRMLVFSGSCTTCGTAVANWEDLSQRLMCLDAKNSDAFGECSAGIFYEQHQFDQECDACANVDEGVGDLGNGPAATVVDWKRSAETSVSTHKKQKT